MNVISFSRTISLTTELNILSLPTQVFACQSILKSTASVERRRRDSFQLPMEKQRRKHSRKSDIIRDYPNKNIYTKKTEGSSKSMGRRRGKGKEKLDALHTFCLRT